MPITGFLEGYNQQQQDEANLDRTKALSLQTMVESQARIQDIQNQMATRSILTDLAQKNSSTGPDGQPLSLGDQYRMAAQRIMPVNPKMSVEMANQAGLMDERNSIEQQKRLMVEQGKAQKLASYLGAANSAETYRPLMMQYMSSGGQMPQWYTGDYDTDKPYIEAASNAALTREQQVTNDVKQTRLQAQQQKIDADIQYHTQQANTAADRAATAQKHADDWTAWRTEQLAQRERETALKRENIKLKQSIVPTSKDVDIAMSTVMANEDLKGLAPASRNAAALEIASMARKAYSDRDVTDPEDYADYLNDAAEEVSKRVKPGRFFSSPTLAPRSSVSSGSTSSSTLTPDQETWVTRAQQSNPGMSRETIIAEGKKRGKL